MSDGDINPSNRDTVSSVSMEGGKNKSAQENAQIEPFVESVRRLYVIESAGVFLALDDAFSCGEVLSEPRIYPLPGCSPSLLGVCHRRGDIVPIYDLESLLNQTLEDRGSARQGHQSEAYQNVHYLPVNRKMHKTYVVIMGSSEALAFSSEDISTPTLGQPAGSIGFSLSAPPKSLLMTDDGAAESRSIELGEKGSKIQGLMRNYIKSVARYPDVELPVLQVDWLGYCLAQVKALEDVEG